MLKFPKVHADCTMTLSSIRYSLVIPCFNEAASLTVLVDKCLMVLEALKDSEIILVNNGSTDDSMKILAAAGLPTDRLRVVEIKVNQGYGNGILTGLRKARGCFAGWTHADLQTDPLDFCRAIALLIDKEGPVLVKGNRKRRPFGDRMFTLGMSAFETLLLRTPLRDINAQPTIFDTASMRTWIEAAPVDFSIDLYVYYKAKQLDAEIIRFPVVFSDREHGQSHWNVNWKSKWKFIRRTVSFSWGLARTLDNR